MKRRTAVFMALAALAVFTHSSYALETGLVDMRSKIFEESKKIRPMIAGSRDAFILSSMWDASIMAATQLDAYFSMVGIINTLEEGALNKEILDYLTNWLNVLKNTVDLDIKSIEGMPQPVDGKVKMRMDNLKGYFVELSGLIKLELGKIGILRKSIKDKAQAN